MNVGTILLIEDDADIREGVRVLLTSEGYSVLEADCGKQGLSLLNSNIDLVILDIMMPGISGIITCEEIRKVSNVPVLFLTAKAQESDKLLGLIVGGDDYLAKPFSYAELLGRVKALLRRDSIFPGKSRRYHIYQGKFMPSNLSDGDWLEHKGIRILTTSNAVQVDGQDIELSEIEYQILLLLIQYPNKIFTTQNIYESVWNEPFYYSSNNTIMVHIRKLRLKIEEDPQQPKRICTVWGKGYRIG